MRLDKVQPTPEEQKRLDDLKNARDAEEVKLTSLYKESSQLEKEGADATETVAEREQSNGKVFAFDRQILELMKEVEARYIDNHSKAEILADAKEIVEAYTREDFLSYLQFQRVLFASIPALDNVPEDSRQYYQQYYDTQKSYATEDYTNCYRDLLHGLRVQLNAMADDPAGTDKIKDLVAERVALWYERPAGGVLLDIGDDTDHIIFTYPKEHIQSLTKANTTIFDSKRKMEELAQFTLDISPNNKPAFSYAVNVDMSAPELKGTENITAYDGSVFDALISVLQANEHGFFTAKQLATHMLYGDNPSKNNPSPQQIGAVTKSIEKQRHIDITIDWTDHARLNGIIPENSTFKVENYMLPAQIWTATINGQTVKGYKMIGTPPLLQYAKSVGQIGTHPVKMLNVPLNLDEQKIVIRDFLLKELSHMTHSQHWGKTITVERILKTAGYINPDDPETSTIDRKKKSQILKAIRTMLDYWKSEGYLIKSYTENIKGKSVYSFTFQTL